MTDCNDKEESFLLNCWAIKLFREVPTYLLGNPYNDARCGYYLEGNMTRWKSVFYEKSYLTAFVETRLKNGGTSSSLQKPTLLVKMSDEMNSYPCEVYSWVYADRLLSSYILFFLSETL